MPSKKYSKDSFDAMFSRILTELENQKTGDTVYRAEIREMLKDISEQTKHTNERVSILEKTSLTNESKPFEELKDDVKGLNLLSAKILGAYGAVSVLLNLLGNYLSAKMTS